MTAQTPALTPAGADAPDNAAPNDLGLDGFEFIEFCAPERGLLEPVFAAMGFTHVAHHRSKAVDLWRQGEINLIANYEPRSPAATSDQPRTVAAGPPLLYVPPRAGSPPPGDGIHA